MEGEEGALHWLVGSIAYASTPDVSGDVNFTISTRLL